jgi:hypothetical protein
LAIAFPTVPVPCTTPEFDNSPPARVEVDPVRKTSPAFDQALVTRKVLPESTRNTPPSLLTLGPARVSRPPAAITLPVFDRLPDTEPRPEITEPVKLVIGPLATMAPPVRVNMPWLISSAGRRLCPEAMKTSPLLIVGPPLTVSTPPNCSVWLFAKTAPLLRLMEPEAVMRPPKSFTTRLVALSWP